MTSEYTFNIPYEVRHILNVLEEHSFEAYIVGGCVRDHLLNREPKDYDVSTSALPSEVQSCFIDYKVIETGLKHGTVTVVIDKVPIEVTTFRIDGEYADYRHPNSVVFTTTVEEDLSRRDFTINAMAYSEKRGLIDPFGGLSDIRSSLIRSVNTAEDRFKEDALRILRALRFASTLNYRIDTDTAKAVFKCRELLKFIAVERIVKELNGILLGDNVKPILIDYAPVIYTIIPELKGCLVDYAILDMIDCLPHEIVPRLAVFLSLVLDTDENKTKPDDVEFCRSILVRLKYDNETTSEVLQLIQYRDISPIADRCYVKRYLNLMGEKCLLNLLELKRAEAGFRGSFKEIYAEMYCMTVDIINKRECYLMKDLAISGDNLIALGIEQGRRIGDILNQLLQDVIEEKIENIRTVLLEKVGSLKYSE